MPPASPVPPLPATCDAPTIARWLLDSDHLSRAALAVSVRALVEAKVREAVAECPVDQPTRDFIVSRVLGGAS